MDALITSRSTDAPTSSSATPSSAVSAAPSKAVTQVPVVAEPDPYVWVPADNPLLGQAPRPTTAPAVKADSVTTSDSALTGWQWREALIGLGVGAAFGAALGAAAFKAFTALRA